MVGNESGPCLNCGHPLDNRYCPSCGQKNTSFRVSLTLVLKEILSEAFELDGRVPRTLVPFFSKPGFLTREYNAGRRASYTSPFRLFLAMTLLWVASGFVFAKTTDYEAALRTQDNEAAIRFGSEGEDGAGPQPVEFTDEASALWLKQVEHRMNELQNMPQAEMAQAVFEGAVEAVPKAMLLLLPVFALMLKILFWGTGRFYVEHLIFALHSHAMAFFVLTLSFLIDQDFVQSLLPLGLGVYVFLALRNAYDAGWGATAARFAGLFFGYGLIAMIVTGAMVIAMVLV
jgi:hypothetical protein